MRTMECARETSAEHIGRYGPEDTNRDLVTLRFDEPKTLPRSPSGRVIASRIRGAEKASFEREILRIRRTKASPIRNALRAVAA
jgi:hypothetical protein